MHIIVCIKSVIMRAPKGRAVRSSDSCELNPFDRPALEVALHIFKLHIVRLNKHCRALK